MVDKGILTEDTPDSTGYRPDRSLIGTTWKHQGNNHLYFIVGFAWCGDGDVWHIIHQRVDVMGGSTKFTRPVANFFGKRLDGGVRYVQQS